jgi:hypothetical protein
MSTKKCAVIKIIIPIIIDFVEAAPTYPITISKADKGADSISLIVPINFGKYIPNEAFEILWVKTVSIIKPGTINAPYGTSEISSILEPMAVPKTIKYKDVEITGATKL